MRKCRLGSSPKIYSEAECRMILSGSDSNKYALKEETKTKDLVGARMKSSLGGETA